MNKWYDMYIPELERWGFYLDKSLSSPDYPSYKSYKAEPSAVKKHFKDLGFANTEQRVFMAHTGNPHVNLEDRNGNTVQVSWWTKIGRPVGVSFLEGVHVPQTQV